MFYVKHVRPDGCEYFFEVERVVATPANSGGVDATGPYEGRSINLINGQICVDCLSRGSIYVMNEKGATIQQYHLRDREPEGHQPSSIVPRAAA